MLKLLKRFYGTGPNIPPLEDPEAVDQKYRSGRLRMMLAITFCYGIGYTCRLPLSVIKKPLIDEGIFTPEELGIIGSGLLYGYGLGKLFNGFLADHANVKRFFATGLLMSALINLVMGGNTALSVGLCTALWALNGWFQGFGAPASATVLSNWFGNKERGTYYGIWSTAHAIGEGLTFFVTAAVVAAFGWRAGFWGPGLLCVLVAIVLYLALMDRPQTQGLPPVASWQGDTAGVAAEGQMLSRGQAQLMVLASPVIWVMGLANATMYVSRYAINNWGILYLQEDRGYSLEMAGFFLTLNTVAGIVGSVAYGLLSDRMFNGRRPPANLIFGLVELAALVVIFYAPPGNPVLLSVAFAFYGFSLSGILASLGGLFAIDLSPRAAAGAAMGFIGVFGYLGAAIQDQVSGTLIQSGMTVVDGVKHYDFSVPIVFWVGASAVSLVLATTLWRARSRD